VARLSQLRLVLTAIALGLAAAPAAAVESEPRIAPLVSNEISSGVHLLAVPSDYVGALPGNVTIIEQSDGVVVVDSGQTAADGRRVAAFVRSTTPKPVKALVYTHWHGDHPLGASEILAAWPKIRIISTKQTLDTLKQSSVRIIGLQPQASFISGQQQQLRDLIKRYEERVRDPKTNEAARERAQRVIRDALSRIEDYPGTHLVLPTETFADSLMLNDKVRPVRLLYLGRANTDGDAMAWLPKERILIAGDIVAAPTPFGFDSYPADWIRTIGRIKALGFKILIPGHGEPQTDASYLDKLVAAITDIRAQVGPLAKAGVKLDEISKKVNFTRSIALFGDDPGSRGNAQALFFDPMIQSAYKEARGEPILQGDPE
jgi:glyoxylase-like metal-dependent hydrolase (beta-lactamase superfamily II)